MPASSETIESVKEYRCCAAPASDTAASPSRINYIPRSRWPKGIPPVMGAHLMASGSVAPISTTKGTKRHDVLAWCSTSRKGQFSPKVGALSCRRWSRERAALVLLPRREGGVRSAPVCHTCGRRIRAGLPGGGGITGGHQGISLDVAFAHVTAALHSRSSAVQWVMEHLSCSAC